MRLSRPSLPVGEDCGIITVEELRYEWLCGSLVHRRVTVASSYYTFITVVVRSAAYRYSTAVLVDRAHVLHIFIGLVGQEGAASYYYFDGGLGHAVYCLLLSRGAPAVFSVWRVRGCAGRVGCVRRASAALIGAARRRAPLFGAKTALATSVVFYGPPGSFDVRTAAQSTGASVAVASSGAIGFAASSGAVEGVWRSRTRPTAC